MLHLKAQSSPQKYLTDKFSKNSLNSLKGCSNTGLGFIEYFIWAQASGWLPGSGWMKV